MASNQDRMSAQEYRAYLETHEKTGKRSKYRSKKVKENGRTYDSKHEFNRHKENLKREERGEISSLRYHVIYPLEVNGVLITEYEADFVYMENGKLIVEDAKGFPTPEYVIKRNLMKAIYGIEIREV